MVRQASARQSIIDSALTVIRIRGYEATSVDELCSMAGVTKGAFFHHFESKEALAVAAAEYWSSITGDFFNKAPYHRHKDPLDRVLGYVDFRRDIIQGKLPEFTCLVGTMVQETYETHPAIREACHRSIFGHAAVLEKDIELAKKLYVPKANWAPKSLALHTQAVLQGAFILAKASNSPEVASDSIEHLHRYIKLLFSQQARKRRSS